MPYAEEHIPWELGKVLFEFEGMVKINPGQTRTIMVPVRVARAAAISDDQLLALFVENSPVYDDEIKQTNRKAHEHIDYNRTFEHSKQIQDFMNDMKDTGRAIAEAVKERRKVD